jgi:hypothetical protein
MVVANAVAALSEINDSSPTGAGIDLMLGLFSGIFLILLQGRGPVAKLVM